MSLKKAIFINGGAGRVLCSIPALEYYKQNVDQDVVIVAEAWTELFLASPVIRNNVYPVGHKGLFQDKLADKEIISPEPYRLNAFFNQKANLIQAFDMLINGLQDVPKSKTFNLDINKVDQLYGYNTVSQIKAQLGKTKAVVFQPFGSGVQRDGDIIIDPSGRSFEVRDIVKIVDELSKHYAVILMTDIDIPIARQLNVAVPKANILQWMGIIHSADYFLGCDSMGQHYANALGKPATVVIGSTFPENISYPDNKDFVIIDNGKDKRIYSPIRITMDLVADRVNETLMVLDDRTIDKIVKSVTDKLGKTKQKDVKAAVPEDHVHTANCQHSTSPPFLKKPNLV
jgi:hypothetical protein